MRVLRVAILVASLTAIAADAGAQRRPDNRGQSREQHENVSRSPVGDRDRKQGGEVTVTGLLIDAGCSDRTLVTMRRPPRADRAAPAPGGKEPDRTVHPEAERSGAIAQQLPETPNRQEDRGCSITGATLAFALLTDKGRLLKLDEGGNTKAVAAVQDSKEGREMLSGSGPGLKPKVEATGHIRGDRLIVSSLAIKSAK